MNQGKSEDSLSYWVYKRSPFSVFLEWCGWSLGWFCYFLVKAGFSGIADRLVDSAILLRRGNPGAIRTIGYINGLEGKLAFLRGTVVVEGVVGLRGPFANKGFFATYHVAARCPDRALELIARWEWDCVPGSLRMDSCDLSHPDPGAEGIRWVSNGRAFFSDE